MLKILDCTLRDGGYYNNWCFDKKLINEYLRVMDLIKIDYVEIGFKFIDKIRTKGPSAYSNESFLRSLKIPKNLKIGIMINAADFVNQKNILRIIKKNFILKKKSLISLIRIACHSNEIESIIPVIKLLKKLGYTVGVNIMQIPELSKKDIKNLSYKLAKSKADILYFADSLGSLDSSQTKKIIKIIKLNWKGPLGIHTHDNMGRALENSLTAIDNGVSWIDCTVAGMGRGPGNTKTEYLILELKKRKIRSENILQLLNLVKKYFEPLKQKYKWGSNPFYYLAGLNSIHPTFIQEMLADESFEPDDIYSNINHLKTLGGRKFSNELISLGKDFYKRINKGKWEPEKLLKKKDVLIFGPGETVLQNKKKIIRFIKKNKPIIFVLNAITPIPKKFVTAHIVCHTLRLLSDANKYKKMKTPVITPYSSFSKNIKSRIQFKNILSFGLQVKNKRFRFEKNYAVLPNSFAITYALGICTSGEVKRIFLAGLDGYSKDSPKKFEMDEILQNYMSEKKSKKMISLTPTNYKIKVMKI